MLNNRFMSVLCLTISLLLFLLVAILLPRRSDKTKRHKNLGACKDTDEISRLPDDLLVKVLSFLPTKVAVSTSILSKQWEFLWMWLPKLEYCNNNYSESERLRSFIDLNLPLHKAPVIESLRLKFTKGSMGSIQPEDIKLWVVIAVSRCIRELSLHLFDNGYGSTKLPSSLYTCKSLVILKLVDEFLMDVPRMVSLPSLKTLVLRRVIYSHEKSLHQLLSNCPVLQELVVQLDESDHSKAISIIIPSLERLTLEICIGNNFTPLMINTPSLKYFQFTDYFKDDSDIDTDDDSDSYSFDLKDMPKLEEADIGLAFHDINKFVRSIRFVKRLSLCPWNQEDLYRDAIVFKQLEHLKLCSCDSNWSKVLVRLLKDSPNLRKLEICRINDHYSSYQDQVLGWQNHMACVPECLLSSLESFQVDWNI